MRTLAPTLAFLATSTLAAADWNGTLANGDQTLSSGEYFDNHSMTVASGQRVRVTMRGQGLDAYVGITDPEGTTYEVDDADGMGVDAQVEVIMLGSGPATITATSARPGETGAYTLSSQVIESFSVAPLASVDGTLATGDTQMQSGEYFDQTTFTGTAGQRVLIRLASSDLDPYLILIGPNGERQEVDDTKGFNTNCLIEHVLESSGEWSLGLTSAAANETGAYQLRAYSLTAAAAPAPTNQAPGGMGGMLGMAKPNPNAGLAGTLAAGDQTLDSGEYYDRHIINAQAGQRLRVTMRGQGIDAYLGMSTPNGMAFEIDDSDGMGTDAQLNVLIATTGDVELMATSARPGETGGYQISTDITETFTVQDLGSTTASLAAGDSQMASGEYYDLYTFTGTAGQRVLARAYSASIDPYLMLIGPNGERVEIDDSPGFNTDAEIEHVLESAGQWQLGVTSAAANETGEYLMTLVGLTPATGTSAPATTPGPARVGKGTPR